MIKENIICHKCGERKAVVQYSESILEWNHFGATPLCRQCYIKKIENELKQIQSNLNIQRKLLANEEFEKKQKELLNKKGKKK